MTEVYPASRIKRYRATRTEVETRRTALVDIVSEMKPMTVRQVFYQAVVRGIVEKSESSYDKVQNDLVLLRRSGALPYGWLTDNTRSGRRIKTFNSVADALNQTAGFYRKALWNDVDAYVEVWLEKDALSGVVSPITDMFDVSLMVSRGYASLSFLHDAAECINGLDVPAYIYHFGDFDPSGQDAARNIEETLREFAPDADIRFERVAVQEWQIEEWSLPTRPTKMSDSRAKGFGSISVELDAIHPDRLRGLVQCAIERHLPSDQLRVLQTAEESERSMLRLFANDYGRWA